MIAVHQYSVALRKKRASGSNIESVNPKVSNVGRGIRDARIEYSELTNRVFVLSSKPPGLS